MGSRPIGIAIIVLSGAFAGAWHLELWLIVVTMAAIAVVLITCERSAELALAQRAAVWALYAPHGKTQGSDLERAITADLAATAVADTVLLEASAACVANMIADPWLRALAIERLQLAKNLTDRSGLPRPPLAWNVLASRGSKAVATTATLALGLAAATTGQKLLLVPFTLGVAVVGTAHGEARRRDGIQRILCDEACTTPQHGLVLMPEPAIVAAITSLTSSRRRVLRKATSLVSHAGAPQRDVALARLRRATLATPDSPGRTLTRDVLAWVVVSAVIVVMIDVL